MLRASCGLRARQASGRPRGASPHVTTRRSSSGPSGSAAFIRARDLCTLSLPMDSDHSDKEALLARLHAHGQSFLASFASLPDSSAPPKRKRRKLDYDDSASDRDDEPEHVASDNEWIGFGSGSSSSSEDEESLGDSDSFDDSTCLYQCSRSLY